MPKKPLPPERRAITHKFRVGGTKGYLTVGLYEDGTPGEVFLVIDKTGGFEKGMCSCWAIILSMALQRGVPLEEIVGKCKGVCFDPAGVTGSKTIPMASSIVDYIGKWLELQFCGGAQPMSAPKKEATDATATEIASAFSTGDRA